MSEKTDIDNLTNGLSGLSVKPKAEIKDDPEPVEVKLKQDPDDDGYNSANSEDTSSSVKKEASEDDEGEANDGKPTANLDDEVELQPLSFTTVGEDEKETIQLISRGPVPIDQESNVPRYHPYRTSVTSSAMSGAHLVRSTEYEAETGVILPTPNVMILRKFDTVNPSKLDAPVSWSNKYEICIERHRLPDETYFGKQPGMDNKVQLFIQLNPNIRELKSFLADVRTEIAEDGQTKVRFIGPIVISLKTELAGSQEDRLLELTSMEERTAAFNLVNQKDITQLTSGIGPHKDTVLSVLCAQRNPANPGQTFAQIHAVIQRLVTHQDTKVQHTVFKQNNNQISAFEIAAITNNNVAACYLAEVMYNLSPDTRTAIRTLNCKDTQGNTIIHLLARKGDTNQQTLKDLLNMKLTDGTKVFTIVSNSKKQFPMHIATQNIRNQPETIKILYQAMPRSFEVVDDDGMTTLHYACQRTNDVSLVRTILSYKKDNINLCNRDGLTALDLVMSRTQVTAQTKGMFAVEPAHQDEIVQLMRNNGAKTGLEMSRQQAPPTYFSPPHSVSPMGSPYSFQTSPRTESVDSPVSYGGASVGSVGYYQQSLSPDSVNVGSPLYQQVMKEEIKQLS